MRGTWPRQLRLSGLNDGYLAAPLASPPCKLTLVHDDSAPAEIATVGRVAHGWPFILSNLKSSVETSQPLPVTVS